MPVQITLFCPRGTRCNASLHIVLLLLLLLLFLNHYYLQIRNSPCLCGACYGEQEVGESNLQLNQKRAQRHSSNKRADDAVVRYFLEYNKQKE